MITGTHPIRPIGPRVLVRPVRPVRDESKLVQELDEPPVTQGDVLNVGHPYCEDCGGQIRYHVRAGMRVLMRPAAIVQEVSYDGDTLWMVPIADIIGEVPPLDA